VGGGAGGRGGGRERVAPHGVRAEGAGASARGNRGARRQPARTPGAVRACARFNERAAGIPDETTPRPQRGEETRHAHRRQRENPNGGAGGVFPTTERRGSGPAPSKRRHDARAAFARGVPQRTRTDEQATADTRTRPTSRTTNGRRRARTRPRPPSHTIGNLSARRASRLDARRTHPLKFGPK